ncbi:Hypothetical predicted protein [Pelobates cultripes]|uniref:Uncharacterized protein n=1 Tax=Pelobates cultripes TaxID=61616 RepID=A0AAD1S9Y3_PELCU|nr:Hypothetical predicted protein [Pelobates cultripes]
MQLEVCCKCGKKEDIVLPIVPKSQLTEDGSTAHNEEDKCEDEWHLNIDEMEVEVQHFAKVFSPTPSQSSDTQMPLEGELRAIVRNLLTKVDFEALSDRLGRVVREEIAQLHSNMGTWKPECRWRNPDRSVRT